jgi:hypothetical protein
MPTPIYKGAGQPAGDTGTGWLSGLGSVFGGASSPAYVSEAPSTAITSAPTTTTTPTTSAAPVVSAEPNASDVDPSADGVIVLATCPIDPAALGAGQIAIVVPRRREDPHCRGKRRSDRATE